MGDSKKILLVDRGTDTGTYLINFIPLLGSYEIEQATHPIPALAKVNAFKPLLLVYNLTVSQAHARSLFLKEIRDNHPATKILVIVANALEKAELKKDGLEQASDLQILVHPFSLTDLSTSVKQLVPVSEEPSQEEYAKLLVADDEVALCDVLSENFRELGLDVYTAYDGKAALETFKKNDCNLAIIDLTMPELNGRDVIKMLQQSESPPRAIIILTAALGETTVQLRRMGIPVVEKPMDPEMLGRIILEACEKNRLTIRK